MATCRAKVTEGGRVVIPVEVRRELGMQPGADLVLDVTDGELRIRSAAQAVARAQGLVRHYVPTAVSLADELIRERHHAARHE